MNINSKLKTQNSKLGFTLIELLVIISIMGLLLTIGLAYYQNFNRRQIVVQAAGDLRNNLRLAQSKALAGEKPEGCTGTLLGWRVDFGAEEYTISAKCSGNPLSASKTYPLVKGVTCTGTDWILFKPLAQGTETSTSQQPEVTLSGEGCNCSSKVTISKSGEITIEENVPYVPPPTPTPESPTPTPIAGCLEEGEIGYSFQNCCSDLKKKPLSTWDSQAGQCNFPQDQIICLNCPNGNCGLGENFCNCSEDCSVPIPTPTPSCIPEGGTQLTVPGARLCCPGLATIENFGIDEEGCYAIYGGLVCAYCPNGVCGLRENYCNCSQDCPAP